MKHDYEKLDENLNVKYCPTNDLDGSITGHIVFGLKYWFDENPEERIRLGWIKHIRHFETEIEYDKQTQYLVQSVKQIDDYTLEDEYHVMDKSEDMMALEEMLESLGVVTNTNSGDGITFRFGGWEAWA